MVVLFNFLRGKCNICVPWLCQAHRTTFWMGNFGHDTPKNHVVWSNDASLLDAVHTRAGYMSRDDQESKPVKLVRKYIDKNGEKRHVGIRPNLRKSQILRIIWECFPFAGITSYYYMFLFSRFQYVVLYFRQYVLDTYGIL